MDKWQKGILDITIASFLIFVFLSLANPKKSVNWIKWYLLLQEKEKKNYNPEIALNNIKRILLLVGVIGIVGLILSIFINKLFAIPTFILILLVFIVFIKYTGPKISLIIKKWIKWKYRIIQKNEYAVFFILQF